MNRETFRGSYVEKHRSPSLKEAIIDHRSPIIKRLDDVTWLRWFKKSRLDKFIINNPEATEYSTHPEDTGSLEYFMEQFSLSVYVDAVRDIERGEKGDKRAKFLSAVRKLKICDTISDLEEDVALQTSVLKGMRKKDDPELYEEEKEKLREMKLDVVEARNSLAPDRGRSKQIWRLYQRRSEELSLVERAEEGIKDYIRQEFARIQGHEIQKNEPLDEDTTTQDDTLRELGLNEEETIEVEGLVRSSALDAMEQTAARSEVGDDAALRSLLLHQTIVGDELPQARQNETWHPVDYAEHNEVHEDTDGFTPLENGGMEVVEHPLTQFLSRTPLHRRRARQSPKNLDQAGLAVSDNIDSADHNVDSAFGESFESIFPVANQDSQLLVEDRPSQAELKPPTELFLDSPISKTFLPFILSPRGKSVKAERVAIEKILNPLQKEGKHGEALFALAFNSLSEAHQDALRQTDQLEFIREDLSERALDSTNLIEWMAKSETYLDRLIKENRKIGKHTLANAYESLRTRYQNLRSYFA